MDNPHSKEREFNKPESAGLNYRGTKNTKVSLQKRFSYRKAL
jgi:hypothetical protein